MEKYFKMENVSNLADTIKSELMISVHVQMVKKWLLMNVFNNVDIIKLEIKIWDVNVDLIMIWLMENVK